LSPSFSSGVTRAVAALLRSHICSSSASALYPAKAAALDRSRINASFLWRRLPVLDLTGQDIDHELGELVCIAGSFWALDHSHIMIDGLANSKASTRLIFSRLT
jgi:hypothetical protein